MFSLCTRLQLVERAVQQNANHRAQLDYRDLPDIAPLNLVSSTATAHQEKAQRGKGDAALGFGGKGLGGLGGVGQIKGKGSSILSDGHGSKAHTPGGSGQDRHGSRSQQQSRSKKPGSSAAGLGMGSIDSGLSPDGEELGQEKVRKLFSFTNTALVQNRAVTAMAWNAASSDLLAVGYGKTEVFSDVYKPGEALDEEKLVWLTSLST